MSKELEALKRINEAFHTALLCAGVTQEDIKTEKALTLVEKSLKALEIIKEKEVDVALLKLSDNIERYNELIKHSHLTILYYELTQEEYDLLEEVLLWD